MTRQQFNQLHNSGTPIFSRHVERNPLPSMADPTQDCPISRLQFAANGLPINVTERKMPYSNVPIEQMCTLDRRHNDKFDKVGEMQSLEKRAAEKVQKFKKSQKQLKK